MTGPPAPGRRDPGASVLQRRQVVARLLEGRGDMLVVAGLGAPAWDATAAGDHDLTFPLWGAMGGATMVGLGLALAQPGRRVLVITGDGEMLMGVGGLATVAAQAPANLAICVLDNGRYGETGMQATHTAMGADLATMARGAGIADSGTVTSEADLPAALGALRQAAGPVFRDIHVAAGELPIEPPPRDGVWLRDRFRRALLGAAAAG